VKAVLVAESAFTLSHSVAFTATALGWIDVPSAAAEAAIALSLVMLALDAHRSQVAPRRRMSAQAGARLALLFGAVHGLGFAGGLAELGVPRDARLPALAGFACGVEVAQLAALLICVGVNAMAARFTLSRPLTSVTTYAVGISGSFLFLDRAWPVVRHATALF
jgi:hypothetical protein